MNSVYGCLLSSSSPTACLCPALILPTTQHGQVRGGGNATAAAAAAARAIGTAVTTALSMAQSQVVVQGELSDS